MNNVRKMLMAIADGHEDLVNRLEQLAAVVVYADADNGDVYAEYPDAVEMAYSTLGLERKPPRTWIDEWRYQGKIRMGENVDYTRAEK